MATTHSRTTTSDNSLSKIYLRISLSTSLLLLSTPKYFSSHPFSSHPWAQLSTRNPSQVGPGPADRRLYPFQIAMSDCDAGSFPTPSELSILYMMYDMTNLIFELATTSIIAASPQSQQPNSSPPPVFRHCLSSLDLCQVFDFAHPSLFMDIGGVSFLWRSSVSFQGIPRLSSMHILICMDKRLKFHDKGTSAGERWWY